MIPPHTLSAIRERVDLQALAAEYVSLKKAGPEFLCLCPWHKDSQPSCRVYRDHSFCYACQTTASPFDWVMLFDETTFRESVTLLANRCGISLEAKPVTKLQLGYAQQEAEFCAWWWKRKEVVLLELAHSEDDWDTLESIGRIQDALRAMLPAERFQVFVAERTDGERRAWRGSVQEQEDLREGLMNLWLNHSVSMASAA